jgi:hypothetical protein
MTENQKIHRLLGRITTGGKKTLFYDDLLEDFNNGLWFRKIDEKELINLCQVLVKDELAHFVAGSHAAVAHPSDKESSKGITINNNAYTAFEDNRYLDGSASVDWSSRIALISILAVAGLVVYVFYLKNDHERQLEQLQIEKQQVVTDKDKIISQKDSLVAAKDTLINRQKARIKELEQPPKASAQKARRR